MEPIPSIPADTRILREHFLHHLNRVHYGKNYLYKNLPGLIELSSFKKLQQTIIEVWEDVGNQIKRLNEIYKLIDATPDKENCVPIIAVFKDAFDAQDYQTSNGLLNDIDTILYLQLLEHINITSYRMLKILAEKLQYIKPAQLLLECYDEAADDSKLLLMIAEEYIKL